MTQQRFTYDRDTGQITDTGVMLDVLRIYAQVPYHENGELITVLLNKHFADIEELSTTT